MLFQDWSYNKYNHRCGGTLISNSHVLTAQHCVDNMSPDKLRVIVGQDNHQRREEREMSFDVKRLWLHPDYK